MSVAYDFVAYTDGGSDNEDRVGRCGYGVWGKWQDGTEVSIYGAGPQGGTNNVAELMGYIEFLNYSIKENFRNVEVWLDSKYVLKGATDHVKTWVKNDWMTSAGTPVKNKELWEEIIELTKKFKGKIKHQWVKGHSGNLGNENADELAGKGKVLCQNKNFEVHIETGPLTKEKPAAKKLKRPTPNKFIVGRRMIGVTDRPIDSNGEWFIYNSSSYENDDGIPYRNLGKGSSDYLESLLFTKKKCPILDMVTDKQNDLSVKGLNVPFIINVDKVFTAKNWKDMTEEEVVCFGNKRDRVTIWDDEVTLVPPAPRLMFSAIQSLTLKSEIISLYLNGELNPTLEITDVLFENNAKGAQVVKSELNGVKSVKVKLEHNGKKHNVTLTLNADIPTKNALSSMVKQSKGLRAFIIKHNSIGTVVNYSTLFVSDDGDDVMLCDSPFSNSIYS